MGGEILACVTASFGTRIWSHPLARFKLKTIVKAYRTDRFGERQVCRQVCRYRRWLRGRFHKSVAPHCVYWTSGFSSQRGWWVCRNLPRELTASPFEGSRFCRGFPEVKFGSAGGGFGSLSCLPSLWRRRWVQALSSKPITDAERRSVGTIYSEQELYPCRGWRALTGFTHPARSHTQPLWQQPTR